MHTIMALPYVHRIKVYAIMAFPYGVYAAYIIRPVCKPRFQHQLSIHSLVMSFAVGAKFDETKILDRPKQKTENSTPL